MALINNMLKDLEDNINAWGVSLLPNGQCAFGACPVWVHSERQVLMDVA